VRDGFLIREQACPRCAIRRTVHFATGTSFCFNCRLQWPAPAVLRKSDPLPLPVPQPFGLAEQARLAHYRAAVRAGFYTDWPAAQAA
jgi:hypothetical protein